MKGLARTLMGKKGKGSKIVIPKGPIGPKIIKDIYTGVRGTPGTRAKTEWVHVSSLYDFCPKRELLLPFHKVAAMPFMPGIMLKMIMDEGTTIHEWFQNRYLIKMPNLIGNWDCVACKLRVHGAHPKACADCKGDKFTYHEETLRYAPLKIVGSPDALLDNGVSLDLLELKTISKDGFITLSDPCTYSFMPKYLHQVQCYMGMLNDAGRTCQRAVILYICRDNMYKMKSYDVPYDPAVWEFAKKRVGEYRKNLKAAMSKTLISKACAICKTKEEGKKRGCEVWQECFGEKRWERRLGA